MKNIVILGAGYGGVVAARGLAKKYAGDAAVSITLIDKRGYQLYAPNLYEIATADEELTEVLELEKSISIPLQEVFNGLKVNVVTAEITHINQAEHCVLAGTTKFEYDYLIVALGSQTDYFNIRGAAQFTLPLKTLPDALRIRNQIEFAIQAHRLDVNKKNVRFIVAGGGYTGVELVAELAGLVNILCWKNAYPREKVEIVVVEATSKLIPGFSENLSSDALARLEDLGVHSMLSSPIIGVDEHFVSLLNGDLLQYDVMIWSTGVRASAIPFSLPMQMDRKGRVLTDEFLRSKEYQNIFVIGDCACVLNSDGVTAPPTAQDAIAQAEYLVSALPLLAKNQRPIPYHGQKHGFIVSMGGKWSVLSIHPFYIKGWLAYVVHQCVHLNYYRKVVGWGNAFKYIRLQEREYSRND